MIKAKIPGTNKLFIKDGIFRGPHAQHVIPVHKDDRVDYTLSTFNVDEGHNRLITFGKLLVAQEDITFTLDQLKLLQSWMVLRQATSFLRLTKYYANTKST